MKRVLIAAPVRDRAWILYDYLDRIKKLDLSGVEAYYYFIVDYSLDDSVDIVKESTKGWDNCEVEVIPEHQIPVDEDSRVNRLQNGIYPHLKELRQQILDKAKELDVDYLFSVDSDVLIEPNTLQRLLSHEKDFVYLSTTGFDKSQFRAAWTLKGIPNNRFSKPSLRLWKSTNSGGLVPVYYAGMGFLVSKEVINKCSYYFEPNQLETNLLLRNYGEDCWFGCSADHVGIPRYLDEGCLALHAYPRSGYTAPARIPEKKKSKEAAHGKEKV